MPITEGLAISATRYEGLIENIRGLESEDIAWEALMLMTIPL